MSLPVACPGCGATIEAKEEWVGFKIPCPKCRHEVTVVASSTSPADAAAFPPLEALGNSLHLTAAVRFRVVYQAGKYEVPLLHVGKP